MKPRFAALASTLLAVGCGGDSSGPSGVATAPDPVAAPAPTPSPSPTPAPTPTPSPSPAATPSPTAYQTFSELLIFRRGASIELQSACAGFAFQGQPPALLPVARYGQGLAFRYVITPQVWAISGDASVGFDGRDFDPSEPDAEVALARAAGAIRFTIVRPTAAAKPLDYARLASLTLPVQGVSRTYRCVTGVPTLPADLPTSPSGAFGRGVVAATAYVRDGSTSRAYSLDRSPVSISADLSARRVTISLRLIGAAPGAPDLDLGSYSASAPIDPATGDFTAALTRDDRSVAATISGRFFGPGAVEVAAAFDAAAPDGPAAPGFTAAGAVFAVR